MALRPEICSLDLNTMYSINAVVINTPRNLRIMAERIRERIARHSFLAGDGLHIHLTASVGVATLPDVAGAADELVQAADAAMYRVKDRGKNGIQAAPSGR